MLNSHACEVNAANQRTRQTFTAGNYADYGYDNIGQLTPALGKVAGGRARIREDFTYSYDPGGNLFERQNDQLEQDFYVNELNEPRSVGRDSHLTAAGTTASPATNVAVNGSTATFCSDNTFPRRVTVNSDDVTLTAIAHDAYGRAEANVSISYLPSTNSFVYDLNGNLRTNGTRVFDYDDENELVAITEPAAWKSEFVYDGKMRRCIRREYVWQSGIWNLQSEIRYVYDGNLVIEERDSSNLPQVAYTRGKDLSGSLQGAGGIGGLLARTSNSDLLSSISSPSAHAYYHADGNGNITCLIGGSQQIVAKYLYDPFGNTLSLSGPLAEANLYRFSSKEIHPSSGCLYSLYRFYEPNSQRWLNRDPLGDEVVVQEASRAYPPMYRDVLRYEGSGNLFTFNHNNPCGYVDSDGRGAITIPVGGVIIIGGVIIVTAVCYATPSCRDWLNRAAEGILDRIKDVCKPKPKPPSNSCQDSTKNPTAANCRSCCLWEYSVGSTGPARNEPQALETLKACQQACDTSGGKEGPRFKYFLP